jgi:ATP-dependent Clp protease ATP-binding subunit ClpB
VTVPVGPTEVGAPPSWLRELETALLTNSQVIVYGNVRDQYLLPENGRWRVRDMRYCIWSCLRQAGFPFLLVADPVEGLHAIPPEPETAAASRS